MPSDLPERVGEEIVVVIALLVRDELAEDQAIARIARRAAEECARICDARGDHAWAVYKGRAAGDGRADSRAKGMADEAHALATAIRRAFGLEER